MVWGFGWNQTVSARPNQSLATLDQAHKPYKNRNNKHPIDDGSSYFVPSQVAVGIRHLMEIQNSVDS